MKLTTHKELPEGDGHLFTFEFSGGGVEIETRIKIAVNDRDSARRFAGNFLAEMAREMRSGRPWDTFPV